MRATLRRVPGDKPRDQRFLETLQVRVRKPNPLIERKKGPAEPEAVHIDDDPTAAMPGLDAPPEGAPAFAPQLEAPLDDDNSELGSSIYDRIEHTDRSDELAEAEAELESALEGFAHASDDQLPAVIPQAPAALEETRTYLGPEPDTRPDPKPRAGPKGDPAPPDRAPTVAQPRAGAPASQPDDRAPTERPRPSQERPALGRSDAPRASEPRRGAPAPRPSGARPAPARAWPAAPPTDAAVTDQSQPDPVGPEVPAAAALDRATTSLEAPRAPPRADPTTRGRAGRRRDEAARLDSAPTPVEGAAAPRVSGLLDDDETVLASEPPRAGHHRTEHDEPGIRLVRRSPAPASPAEPAPAPSAPPAPRPRERLAMLGTDAAGEVMKEHALQALGGSLPPIRTPALKLVRGELSEASLGVLEAVFAGRFEHEGADPSASAKRCLERLVNDKSYNALTPKEQAVVLRTIAAAPEDVATVKAATALLKSGVARRLNQAHRQSMLRLFAGLAPEARVRVAQLAARRLRGRSALEDRDMQDQPLVAHLEQIVSGRRFCTALEARGVTRAKCVSIVLGAIAHPERLSFEEGSAGVLGMLEFGLADTAPAELARLWRHLAFDDMVVPLAAGAQLDLGARLAAEPGLELTGASTPLRVALEGLAELARPGRSRKPTFIMPGGHGVDADVISKALELVYGFGFTVAAGATNAMRHLSRVSEPAHRLPPVYVTVLYARGERLFLFDHADDDWVYLRAPRGRSTKQRGALRIDPRREVVDPDRGLDRIPKEAFEEKVGVGLIPRL